MRDWLRFVTRNRLLEIALAVALGLAAYEALATLSDVTISALAQNVGRNPNDETGDAVTALLGGTNYLYFSVGDTYIVYGPILVTCLAVGLVVLVGLVVIRRRDRELGMCPFCASRIPYESRHCAYCGSGVEPGEP
jgi:hypothetical protein